MDQFPQSSPPKKRPYRQHITREEQADLWRAFREYAGAVGSTEVQPEKTRVRDVQLLPTDQCACARKASNTTPEN